MKKIILLLCLIGAISLNAQSWKRSDGTVEALNADHSLANPNAGDLVYEINGETFNTRLPVSPKLYLSDRVLGIHIVGDKLVIKHTGYIRKSEWIGRIVWKEVYTAQNGAVELQGIVDGNYTPPQTSDERVTFSDEFNL